MNLVRRLVIPAVLVPLVMAGFAASDAAAKAPPPPPPKPPPGPHVPYTVSVSPGSLVAGSTGNTLTFSFRATDKADGQVTVVVPQVVHGHDWTRPQSLVPANAGYVAASKQTCKSASVASVSGPATGPWTILVNAKCDKNNGFALTYGAAGPAGVTAATFVGAYTFATSAQVGKTLLALSPQPVVNVVPATGTTLTLTAGGTSTAGDPGSATVSLRDGFGNPATGYRGQVHFSSSDAQAALPADYTFTATDAGTHTFTNVLTLKTAGSQTITATDTATSSLTDTQPATVNPGPAATLGVSGLVDAVAGTAQSLTVTARDSYGNTATGYTGTVHFTGGSGDPVPADHTFTAAAGPFVFCLPACDNGVHTFTLDGHFGQDALHVAGVRTITATDTVTSTITGGQTVTISHGPQRLVGVGSTVGGEPTIAGVLPSVGQILTYTYTVEAQDNFANVATEDDSPVTLTVTVGDPALPPRSVQVIQGSLDHGRHTFEYSITIDREFMYDTVTAAENGVPSPGGGFGEFYDAQSPNLESARLYLEAPNIDGGANLYIPNLNMQIDPTTIHLTADAVVSGDLTVSMPVQAMTIGGDSVDFVVQTSTGFDANSGNYLPGTLPKQGDDIQITGCTGGTCPSSFLDPTKVRNGSAIFKETHPGQDQLVVMWSLRDITFAGNCRTETEMWDETTQKCIPYPLGTPELRLGPANFFGIAPNGIRLYTSDFGGTADSMSRTYTVQSFGSVDAGKVAVSLHGDLARWAIVNDGCTGRTLTGVGFPLTAFCSFDVIGPLGGCAGLPGQLDETNVEVNLDPQVNAAPELSLEVSNTCP